MSRRILSIGLGVLLLGLLGARVDRGFASEELPRFPQVPDFSIIHGGKLVLLDASGTIRGYFEADEVDRITRSALQLAEEIPGS